MKILIPIYIIVIIAAIWLDLWSGHTRDSERELKREGFVFCGRGDLNGLIDNMVPQLYDTLVFVDTKSSKTEPRLATSWRVSADKKTYTLKIRKGVHFHATPWFHPTRMLEAKDVVFSFKRIIDPDNPFYHVGIGASWLTFFQVANNIKSVTSLSKNQVQFKLKQKDDYFLRMLSSMGAVILSEEYADQLIKIEKKINIDLLPIGTGPFYLSLVHPFSYATLRRNEQYWGQKAHMSKVVFDMSIKQDGLLSVVQRRGCDVVASTNSAIFSQLKESKEYVFSRNPTMNTTLISLNTKQTYLKQLKVRKAIDLAIDRKKIRLSIYQDSGTEAYSLLPTLSKQTHKGRARKRNVELAKQVMAEAGYENGFKLVMSVPRVNGTYNHTQEKVAQIIVKNLAEINIKVEIAAKEIVAPIDDSGEVVESNEEESPPESDMALRVLRSDAMVTGNSLSSILSCAANREGQNISSWCHVGFDRLNNKTKSDLSEWRRIVINHRLRGILEQELPVIPIVRSMHYHAHHRSLIGVSAKSFRFEPFNKVMRTE